MLTANERMMKLCTADPKTLARIDAVLTGEDSATAVHAVEDLRSLTLSDAARHLNVSRATVHTMVNKGRLSVVVLNGSRRVPMAAISALMRGERPADDRAVEKIERRREHAKAAAERSAEARRVNARKIETNHNMKG